MKNQNQPFSEEKLAHFAKGTPPKQGLYDPQFERDACGVGFIANMDGRQSHQIIFDALNILVKLTHRGACSCDNRTGDGAGLLLQIPDAFCRKVTASMGFELPEKGCYGTGLVFLPKDETARKWIKDQFEAKVVSNGHKFLGWRELPVDKSVLGEVAARTEPHMEQIFIERGEHVSTHRDFERELFIIRKGTEKAVAESDLSAEDKDTFYVPTLSCHIIIYKGLLQPEDFAPYFVDLLDKDMETCLALVHQRFSTNTFPAWKRAQPFRFVCHNGEINTIRGNENWMNTRQYNFHSDKFGDRMSELFPIVLPDGSDSQRLDNCLELLYHTGRELPHAMMMMVPEAWQNHKTMSAEKKAFYEYHSCLMEPWDGPALMPFTDGTLVGGILDRNGLRPCRWLETKDKMVVCASETGMLDIPPEDIVRKGRLQPGRMFLVNLEEGRIVEDEEIKHALATRQPYGEWLKELINLEDIPAGEAATLEGDRLEQQNLFGYTLEDLRIVLKPMCVNSKEALGSMGVDTPLAVLSDKPQLMYNYFKQLFAQVTNPPLDGIREEIVTSIVTNIGRERDLFDETPKHCHQIRVDNPILTNENLARLRELDKEGKDSMMTSSVIPIHFDVSGGGAALGQALTDLQQAAEDAVNSGSTILILSDRGAGKGKAPLPALLATGAVHHHLIKKGIRTLCGLVIETGEARECHHFACLFGYGAGAVNPYMAFESIKEMAETGYFDESGIDAKTAQKNYIKACVKGVLKIMSKIGISTLHSYRGAQIFEALGLHDDVVNAYFTGTASRIQGADLDALATEIHKRYERTFPSKDIADVLDLDVGGLYQWRRRGEHHSLNPLVIATLQQATKIKDKAGYRKFAAMVNDQNEKLCTLRGLFAFKSDRPSIPLEEVEDWTDIVQRFKTGAMSYGSISREAHETLAIAMNRLKGKSNSGEGGEEPHRYIQDDNGDSRSSAIKQVASGRFGVTSHYLANAQEVQIKMAQGAKPGEGGQLPGIKVSKTIAAARHSTPLVGLISPPPHHDIYSIEDLAQLIHDLKCANRHARINVKLVSEVGVGTVAAGVSKGKADVVLVSGWDGGTGASPETSLKHAGLPWELGVSEAHQTLVLNDLRSRIVLEADGKLMTGRDVAIAVLLGAEEYGFSTAPLVVMGCIMMRVCHLNTCPVGIATQRPELRKKFEGSPDSVINYFHLVAEELREIMAELGFRTINEMVGQMQCLDTKAAIKHYKARNLDLSRVLTKPDVPDSIGIYCTEKQDHDLEGKLDFKLLELCKPAIEEKKPVTFEHGIVNTDRTVGTILSYEISRAHGAAGLPEDTIKGTFRGNAGQSFGAFLQRGVTFTIEGDANDYFGKGCSGGKLIIKPPAASTFKPEENILIGNVACYGATRGQAFINGIAGERFCVRNSGIEAVVEGIGDHGAEYMTGGLIVCLGRTGRNFAAGMSGGIAYILDEEGDFIENRLNTDMVDTYALEESGDIEKLKEMIQQHIEYTGSPLGQRVLDDWDGLLSKWVKVFPTDYKSALAKIAAGEIEDEPLELAPVQRG